MKVSDCKRIYNQLENTDWEKISYAEFEVMIDGIVGVEDHVREPADLEPYLIKLNPGKTSGYCKCDSLHSFISKFCHKCGVSIEFYDDDDDETGMDVRKSDTEPTDPDDTKVIRTMKQPHAQSPEATKEEQVTEEDGRGFEVAKKHDESFSEQMAKSISEDMMPLKTCRCEGDADAKTDIEREKFRKIAEIAAHHYDAEAMKERYRNHKCDCRRCLKYPLGKITWDINEKPKVFHVKHPKHLIGEYPEATMEHLSEKLTRETYQEFDKCLPHSITGPLPREIRKFGNDTYPLLHHVYKTKPMLNAKPNEMLDLSLVVSHSAESKQNDENHKTGMSKTQQKKQQSRMDDLRRRVAEKRKEQKSSSKMVPPTSAPRIDAVYANGITWIEQLGGGPIPEQSGTLEILDDNIWNHSSRVESDLS